MAVASLGFKMKENFCSWNLALPEGWREHGFSRVSSSR